MAESKWPEVKEKLLLVEGWARDGLTDEQIAKNLGIHVATFYDYKNKYCEFSEAVKRGKEVIDLEVENALLKRAMGYKYDEVTKEKILDNKTGKSELAVTKVVTKEVQPDTTAQIFWLKNRKPKVWRDRHQHDLNINNDLNGLTEDEIDKRLKELEDMDK